MKPVIQSLLCALLPLAMLVVSPGMIRAADIPVRTGETYFEVRQPDGSYAPVIIKGVNIGAALPGRFPSEFSYDQDLYYSWISQIGEMNANTIRLYTILPPEFYRAFREYNLNNPDRQLWLIQGVWISPPPKRDFLDTSFMEDVGTALKSAADIIHGKAIVHPRPGHAEGIFDADVSKWMLAWLVGREWEPDDIQGFQALYPEYQDYQGESVSCHGGQPIECWLAQICDIIVTYEDDEYSIQRPVTFSSWPPTDPLSHVSESNIEFQDEMLLDETQGRVDVFSNDAVNISSRSFSVEDRFKAGLYASYHVYTYYPDFIDNDPEYAEGYDRYGRSNYAGYLEALKGYYDDRPLLIAEMGLSNTMLPAHQQLQGWNHGGLSEGEVAEDLPRLFQSVIDTECAGGIVFAWIDEWWKKVWMWAELYDPYEDIRLWYNCLDPEQNFGMVALHPGVEGPTCTLSGNASEWESAFRLTGSDVVSTEPVIREIDIQHDEGYLYFRIQLEDFNDWDFREHGLCLALDILDDGLGNQSLPGPLELSSDSGLEVALVIQNGTARLLQTRSFRYWEPYRVPYSTLPRISSAEPYQLKAESNPRAWVEPVVETNRRRVGKDGSVYPQRIWKVNPMPRGSLNAGSDYNDLAIWNAGPGDKSLEIRLPWMLAGFVGPHQLRVLTTENGKNSSRQSTGIGVTAVLYQPDGQPVSTWPPLADGTLRISAEPRYIWEPWGAGDIRYYARLKPVYYSMQGYFSNLQDPE